MKLNRQQVLVLTEEILSKLSSLNSKNKKLIEADKAKFNKKYEKAFKELNKAKVEYENKIKALNTKLKKELDLNYDVVYCQSIKHGSIDFYLDKYFSKKYKFPTRQEIEKEIILNTINNTDLDLLIKSVLKKFE